MATFRVTCALRAERDERIASLGCIDADNAYFKFTEAEVIARIERLDIFYVERPSGHVARLVIAEREGRKYVKTEADGEKPDNLLSLPACPSRIPIITPPPRSVVPAASHGTSLYQRGL